MSDTGLDTQLEDIRNSEEKNNPGHFDGKHEKRPWGSFDVFHVRETLWVKRLNVTKGQRLSLQSHEKREEYWFVESGTGEVEIDDDMREIKSGDVVHILIGQKHRVKSLSDDFTIIEVATGKPDEHDEVRYEDDYGRTSPNK